MAKRFALVIVVAAAGAALIAVGASADFRSVGDPRGDTKCNRENGGHKPCPDWLRRNADIVRRTAGHGKNGWLKHTIRVVGKFDSGSLWIDSNSDDPGCEWKVGIGRDPRHGVESCDEPVVTHPARYDFHHHHHSVEISFSKTSIGNPQSYGWRVKTWAGESPRYATDDVPNRGAYIRHRLDDSGVAAAGVRALGAQTASAGVHKYDTTLTLTKDGGSDYHGRLWSDRDRNPKYDPATAVRKCMKERRVVLFKKRPGADRRLGAVGVISHRGSTSAWYLDADGDYGAHVRAKVKRKVRDRYVCRADYAAFGAWPAQAAHLTNGWLVA